MDSEPSNETGEKTEPEAAEQAQEILSSKLPDLRPEKDPMGAGDQRQTKTGSDHFVR
jgi:hypothetical protein